MSFTADSLAQGLRRRHSIWTLSYWSTQRDIWTLTRLTNLQPVVSR